MPVFTHVPETFLLAKCQSPSTSVTTFVINPCPTCTLASLKTSEYSHWKIPSCSLCWCCKMSSSWLCLVDPVFSVYTEKQYIDCPTG